MRALVLAIILVSGALAAPVIDLQPDTLHFGSISAGGTQIRQIRVANSGDLPLVVTDVELGNQVFSLTEPTLPDSINPGQAHSFGFQFAPVDEVSYNSVFSFHSNDPVTPTANLIVSARGVPVFEAGEIIWSYQGIENVVSCAVKDDSDGDGIPEVVAESYDAGAQGDNLLCISGSGFGTGHLIWSARPLGGPSNSGGYGDQCLITIDDLNHNGTQDIILGTAWGSRTIFGIEGTDGRTIWSYDLYANPPNGWVYSVEAMDDLNDDGIPEVLAGVGSDANRGFCFNGATGARRWRFDADDVIYSVCRLGDVTNDGVADVAMGEGDYGDAVYCISGNSPDSARPVWTYHTHGSVQSIARISDINDDNFNDVIAGYWNNGDGVMALSGHGDTVTTRIWNRAIGFPVMKVVVCPDLNSDGHEDVLVASWGSFALALSGATGDELWRAYAGDDVWAIYWSYDITGDSIPEVVAGSFDGSVILVDGSTGSTIWTTPTGAKIFTVRPIPDVNGDGFPDLIAGQQMLNGVGGKVLVLSGGTLSPSPIADEPLLPESNMLLSIYPNPFNSATMISYELPHSGSVTIEIYNVNGQKVKSLPGGYNEAGRHLVSWNARDDKNRAVATGIYFCRIQMAEFHAINKMTVLK